MTNECEVPVSASIAPRVQPHRMSEQGVSFLKGFEKCRLRAYKPTPHDRWTIGWGHTGPDVGPGSVVTQAQADALLLRDLQHFERDVLSLVKVPLTQGQFDALVSFAYNVGSDIDEDTKPEGLGDSTLLRKLNAGDYEGAANEFVKWNKQKGQVLNGLTKRRLGEKEMFLS